MGTSSGSHMVEIHSGSHREKMGSLEDALMAHENQIELEAKHHFSHGTYVRELEIPEGVVMTGKIHRFSCTNILLKGKVRVITDEGEYDLAAPHIMITGPGVKKAFAALEDSIWLNVHPWDGEETLEEIEERLIVPSYEALDSEELLWLG